MNLVARIFSLAAFAITMAASLGYAAEVDRDAVDFKTPAEIKCQRGLTFFPRQSLAPSIVSKPERGLSSLPTAEHLFSG